MTSLRFAGQRERNRRVDRAAGTPNLVVASGCPWYILSAEHGLVAPGQVIAPYERTLNRMRVADRRAWGERVAAQLAEAVPNLTRVVFVAGAKYREFLAQHLANRGVEVSVPMEGLRIGEQLSWLGRQSSAPDA